MCQRHIPAGGGAAALAGTRRVALGALGGGVGWGGDGWYWSGGHWRDRCLCGKNRKTRKHVLVSFFAFFVPFFCFFLFLIFLLCHARVFYPSPVARGVNLFITRPKKKMKLKLTLSLYLRTSIMFCHLVSHTLVRSQFSSLSCFH